MVVLSALWKSVSQTLGFRWTGDYYGRLPIESYSVLSSFFVRG